MLGKAREAFSLGAQLVEFRVDWLRPAAVVEITQGLAQFSDRCILTIRSKKEGGKFEGDDEARVNLAVKLCGMRPTYMDLELNTLKEFPEALRRISRLSRVIVSWHDFKGTPGITRLRAVYSEARGFGAVVKIVCMARKVEDNLRVLSLYEGRDKPIAFCMGEKGIPSRLFSLAAGSPLNYASLPGEAVAPGQISLQVMKEVKKFLD